LRRASLASIDPESLPLYEKKWFRKRMRKEQFRTWRCWPAIGYQESRWNPAHPSLAGAKGLCNLPLTRAYGGEVTTRGSAPEHPAEALFRARSMKDPAHVPEARSTWFALAAYTIG